MSHNFKSSEPIRMGTLTDDQIREWIKTAEKREMARSGTNKPQAREVLARNLKLSYWQLVNIVRGRVKGVRGDQRDIIKLGIIRILESEIARLERELALVRLCRTGLSEVNICAAQAKILAAEAALEQARAFLSGNVND